MKSEFFHKLKTAPKSALLPAAVFVLLLFGFTVADLINPVQTFSQNENRVLAQLPKISAETLFSGKFEKDYEKSLNDQFVARDAWVGLKTRTELAAGKRDVNGVYFGEGGFLIETPPALDAQRLKGNRATLSGFVESAAAKLGAGHVRVLLAPTAGEMPFDYLPPFAPAFNSRTVTDGLALPAGVFVDIRLNMASSSNSAPTYYRTDHHWNTLGAYHAYQYWAKSLGLKAWRQDDFTKEVVTQSFLGTLYSKVNVETQPDEITLFIPKAKTSYTVDYNLGEREAQSLYDLAKLDTKDKYAVFLGGNNAVVKITNNNLQNGRRLLIIKDSYAHSFAPFAVNHFEETTMIDLRFFNAGVGKYMEEIGATDVLLLYSAVGFAQDRNLYPLVK